MTDIQISLTVMSAVVALVSAFGVAWLKVERAQAAKASRTGWPAPEGQRSLFHKDDGAALIGGTVRTR